MYLDIYGNLGTRNQGLDDKGYDRNNGPRDLGQGLGTQAFRHLGIMIRDQGHRDLGQRYKPKQKKGKDNDMYYKENTLVHISSNNFCCKKISLKEEEKTEVQECVGLW